MKDTAQITLLVLNKGDILFSHLAVAKIVLDVQNCKQMICPEREYEMHPDTVFMCMHHTFVLYMHGCGKQAIHGL